MPDESCIHAGIGVRCISGGLVASGDEPPDRVIASLAEGQHGVVARRQLLEAGIGPRMIGVRLGRGSLQSVHHGVYVIGGSTMGSRGRWMAAVLACGPGTVLSHRSAASAWGILSTASLPEVTRPTSFRRRAGLLAHRSSVPADERAWLDGIPLTSVARTVLDLAPLMSRRQLERVMHEVEVRQLTGRLSVPDLLHRYPRRRGCRRLRDTLGESLATGVTQNDFEELFAQLVDRHSLPRPRFNADLAVGSRFFKPDCLWQEHGLILELDGRSVHGTRKAFESDRERDRLLLAAGWRVMRITWRQLHDEPEKIAHDLRLVLAASNAASRPA